MVVDVMRVLRYLAAALIAANAVIPAYAGNLNLPHFTGDVQNAGPNSTVLTIHPNNYTVATIPGSGVTGALANVTDAISCTLPLVGGGATFCPIIYNGSAWALNLGGGAAAGVNNDITDLDDLGHIAPPASVFNRLTFIGNTLTTTNDSYVSSSPISATALIISPLTRYQITVPGNTNWVAIGAADNNPGTLFTPTGTGTGTGTATLFNTPSQGLRINYTGTHDWPTQNTGSVSFNGISVTYAGNSGTAAGKGVIGFNVSMQPKSPYDGKELYGASFSIVQLEALNTNSDMVGLTGAVTINNTTELLGAAGSHIYGNFGTVNFGALAVVPIAHIFHGEAGITSGAVVQYINGASLLMNGSSPVKGTLVSAGSFVNGAQYTITTPGNTDFTLVGANDNNQNTVFTAAGPGTGNGTATTFPWSSAFALSCAGAGGINQCFQNVISLEDRVPQPPGSSALPQPVTVGGSWLSYDNQTPCMTTGGVTTGNIATVGSGYVAGTYNGVALTGGNGSGATANIVVGANGAVSSVTIVSKGTKYHVFDVLSANASSLGNSGSGFTWSVASLAFPGPIQVAGLSSGGSGYLPASGTLQYTLVPLSGGSGTGAFANITVTNGAVAGINLGILGLNRGNNYQASDIVSADSANLGGQGSGFTAQVSLTSPQCPTTMASIVAPTNIFYSNGPINTLGWKIDSQSQEQIGAIEMTNLNPEAPVSANDIVFTGLNTRNAGNAIPPLSIPSTLCATGFGNDGCLKVLFGVASNPVSGTPGYIPYYYQAPTGKIVMTGPSVAGAGGTISLGNNTESPGTGRCPAANAIAGVTIAKCRIDFDGATQRDELMF